MQKRGTDTSGYKTEQDLKEEARLRREQQARIDAQKEPASPRKKKLENFWYHYKWQTICGTILLVVAAFFVKDIFFRTNPDLTLLFVTHTPVSGESLEELKTAMENQLEDYNGDGKTVVMVDYIHIPTGQQRDGSAGNQDYASTVKLTTLLATGMEPLYLVDQGMYEYLQKAANGALEPDGEAEELPSRGEWRSMFEPLVEVEAARGDRLAVRDTVLADDPWSEPFLDMSFALRPALEKAKAVEYQQYCLEVLQTLGK